MLRALTLGVAAAGAVHAGEARIEADSALVVVDMQNDFISGSLPVPDAASIVQTINDLVKLPGWKLTVFTADNHPWNHFSFADNSPHEVAPYGFVPAAYDADQRLCGAEYKEAYGGSSTECSPLDVFVNFSQQLWPRHCVQGTQGQKFHKDLYVPSDAVVVKKGTTAVTDSYGAFVDNFVYLADPSGSELTSPEYQAPNGRPGVENTLFSLLRVAEVKRVYVVGLALDYCVKYTALQSKWAFDTFLVTDATKPVFKEAGEEAIEELKRAGVRMAKSSDLTAV